MVGLDSQLKNLPTLFLALLLNQFATAFSNRTNQDRLSALRRPDQMEDYQMNAMLVPYIFHLLTGYYKTTTHSTI